MSTVSTEVANMAINDALGHSMGSSGDLSAPIPAWQERMAAHYAEGNVRCSPASFFMGQEIADLRAALAQSRAAIPEAGQSVPKLTVNEIIAIGHECNSIEFHEDFGGYFLPITFARAIEAKVIASMSADSGAGGVK